MDMVLNEVLPTLIVDVVKSSLDMVKASMRAREEEIYLDIPAEISELVYELNATYANGDEDFDITCYSDADFFTDIIDERLESEFYGSIVGELVGYRVYNLHFCGWDKKKNRYTRFKFLYDPCNDL